MEPPARMVVNTFRLLPPSKSKRRSAVSKLMSLSTSMRRVVLPLVSPAITSISADPMFRLPVARIVSGFASPVVLTSKLEVPRLISPTASRVRKPVCPVVANGLKVASTKVREPSESTVRSPEAARSKKLMSVAPLERKVVAPAVPAPVWTTDTRL